MPITENIKNEDVLTGLEKFTVNVRKLHITQKIFLQREDTRVFQNGIEIKQVGVLK